MVWKLTPLKIPVEGDLEKVGISLSDMPSGLIGSSFCPIYSKKQLRKINRLGLITERDLTYTKKISRNHQLRIKDID